MPKRITNQQSWEARSRLELAKESYHTPSHHSLRRIYRSRTSHHRPIQERGQHNVDIARRVTEIIPRGEEPQEINSIVTRARSGYNPVQFAVGLLYATSILGLTEGARREIIPRLQNERRHVEDTTRTHTTIEKQSTPSPNNEEYHIESLMNSYHGNKELSENSNTSTQDGENVLVLEEEYLKQKKDNQESLVQKSSETDLVEEENINDEKSIVPISEEQKNDAHNVYSKSRKKRAFGELTPLKPNILYFTESFFHRHYRPIYTLLGYMKTLMNIPGLDIWQSRQFISYMRGISQLSTNIFQYNIVNLFDDTTGKIGEEIFDYIDINNMENDPSYKQILCTLMDTHAQPPYRYNTGFLAPIYNTAMSLERKIIVFIILNLLPEHPLIPREVLAQISADIRLTLERGEIGRTGDLNSFMYENSAKMQKYMSEKNNPNIKTELPFFTSQTYFLSQKYYVGSIYGFCASLSLAFLYNMSLYDQEEGLRRMNQIYSALEKIRTFPFEYTFKYIKGIHSLTKYLSGIKEKYILSLADLGDINLYRLNKDVRLPIDVVADLLFNPNFRRDTNTFYLNVLGHALAVVRRYKQDSNIGRFEPVLYYFDSNFGAIECTNKDVFIKMASVVLQPDQLFFRITAIDDIQMIRYYHTESGATFGEFFDGKIIGNPRFMLSSSLFFRTSENRMKKEEAKLQNELLPRRRGVQSIADDLLDALGVFSTEFYGDDDSPSIKFHGLDIREELYDGTLLKKLGEEIEHADSNRKLQEVSNELFEIMNAIEESSIPRADSSIKQEFDEIHKKIKVLQASLEEIYPPLEGKSKIKNIAIIPPHGSENVLSGGLIRESEYRVLSPNEMIGYHGTLHSEDELYRKGVFNIEESIEVKSMMKELDIALAQLLEISGLEPTHHIVPEIEAVKFTAQGEHEFTALNKDELTVMDITTGKETSIKVTADSSFKHIAKKVHTKLSSIHKKMDPVFKGLSTFSTSMTLMQARSMIDTGKVFKKLSALEKTGFIAQVIDANIDVAANTIGAINKVYKTVVHPVSRLSTASRVLGRVSGGIGILTSTLMTSQAAIAYANHPSKYTEMELGFTVTNLALSTITAIYPPLAIFTIPASFLLDYIKEATLHLMEREQEYTILKQIYRQLIHEASQRRRYRKKLNMKVTSNLGILFPRNDIARIIFKNRDKIGIQILESGGLGYTETTASSALFPRNTCFLKPALRQRGVCVLENGMLNVDPRASTKDKCKGNSFMNYYSLTPDPKPIPIDKVDTALKKKMIEVNRLHGLILSDQLIKVKSLKEYEVKRTINEVALPPNQSILSTYINNPVINKIMLCSGFNATTVIGSNLNTYPYEVLLRLKYLDTCTLAKRTCLKISSESKGVRTVVLPTNQYSSREEFVKHMKRTTGCSVESTLDQYACSEIYESNHGTLQVYLQGSNKVKIIPNKNMTGERHGLIFMAENLIEIQFNSNSYMQRNNAYIITGEQVMLRYRDTHVDITDAMREGVPLYLQTTAGFIAHIASQTRAEIVYYSIDLDQVQNSRAYSHSQYGALYLGKMIRDKVSYLVGEQYVPSIFTVDGVYEALGPNGEKSANLYRTALFIPKEIGGKDRVVCLRYEEDIEELVPIFEEKEYKLIHIENYYYDYKDQTRLKGNDNYTAYFYDAKNSVVIVQKGDSQIDSSCVYKVNREPTFTVFGNGEKRLLIRGVAISYNQDSPPQEVHITGEALEYNAELIDDTVHSVASLMSQSFERNMVQVGKILLTDIPYKEKSGKTSTIQGYFSPMTRRYTLDFKYRNGKECTMLPFYTSGDYNYSYFMLKDDDLYKIYVGEPLEYINTVIQDGAIEEELLPQSVELFSDIKIANVALAKEGLVLETADGVVLSVALEHGDFEPQLVSISQLFFETYGYDTSNLSDRNRGIYFAQLLYGNDLYSKHILLTNKDKKVEEVFDVSAQASISLDVSSFYIDKSETIAKKVYVKTSAGFPHIPLDVVDMSYYENLDPFSLNLLGYHHNDDGSQTTYLWCYEADALLVTTKPYINEESNRVYHLELFLQDRSSALIRIDKNHEQRYNKGIVIPNVTILHFQPALSESADIVLNYSPEEMKYLEEIVLDAGSSQGNLPTIEVHAEIVDMSFTCSSNHTLEIHLLYIIDKSEKKVLDISFVGFFTYGYDNNPYNNKVCINGVKYSRDDLDREVKR